jgi:hypothetical protein
MLDREREMAWQEHQRARFLRPDAARYVRPDAARFVRPRTDAAAVMSRLQKSSDRHDASDAYDLNREVRSVASDLRELRWILSELKLMHLCRQLIRKYGFNPSQPRVPAGDPDGGRWTDAGGGQIRFAASEPPHPRATCPA